jgi:hypothetical protein
LLLLLGVLESAVQQETAAAAGDLQGWRTLLLRRRSRQTA